MVNPTGGAAAEQPPPTTTHRRPKAREVSSRLMSPLVQSNSTPIPTASRSDFFPRTKSVFRRQPPQIDENHAPESNRSCDKLSAAVSFAIVQRKQNLQRTKLQSKENGESSDHQQYSDARVSSRADTPMTTGSRIVPSRYRQVSNSVPRTNPLRRSSGEGCAAVTAAARLLQEATSDIGNKLPRISTSSRDEMVLRNTNADDSSSSCPNSPFCVPNTDARSSMTDMDKWRAAKNSGNAGKAASDCARSLNFSSSSYSLPPHPLIRHGCEMKKGKRPSNHQEDVHCLKILSNQILQWRFANAKAEASMIAQKQEAERKFYSVGGTISNICDGVKIKRNELTILRRLKTLTTIVEAQMPNLDEWAAVEEDYSTSLLGTTNALLSSSIRIPVSGEVKADAGELKVAIASALKVLESIATQIQRFMTKAEEMDISVSGLPKRFSGEKVLIEECRDLLSKTNMAQVKECSVRSTLMQSCNKRPISNSED